MLFGAYVGVPALTGYNYFREHMYKENPYQFPAIAPIPASWPSDTNDGYAANTPSCITLYPDPTQLLAGELDTQIKTLFNQAPGWSSVTAYAEADGGGEQYKTALGITNAQMQQIHDKMHSLCASTPVRYGVVLCGFGSTSAEYCWYYDWIGYDIYNWGRNPEDDLNNFLTMVKTQTGQVTPTLAIPETNTNPAVRTNMNRPTWFKRTYLWCAEYEVTMAPVRFFTSYWNPGGNLSGPWNPSDTETIDILEAIGTMAPTTLAA